MENETCENSETQEKSDNQVKDLSLEIPLLLKPQSILRNRILQIDKCIPKFKKLAEEHISLTKQVKELTDKTIDQEKKSKGRQSEIDRLKNELNKKSIHAEKECKEKQSEIDRLQKELNKKNIDGEKKYKEQQSEINRLRDETKKQTKDINSLREENNNYSKDIRKFKKEHAELNAKLDSLRSENKNINEKYNAIKLKNEELSSKNKKLEVNVKEIKELYDSMQEQNDNKKSKDNDELMADLELSSDEDDNCSMKNNKSSSKVCSKCLELESELSYQKALNFTKKFHVLTPIPEEKFYATIAIQTDNNSLCKTNYGAMVNVYNPFSSTDILKALRKNRDKLLLDINSCGYKHTNAFNRIDLESMNALPEIMKIIYNFLAEVVDCVQESFEVITKQFNKTKDSNLPQLDQNIYQDQVAQKRRYDEIKSSDYIDETSHKQICRPELDYDAIYNDLDIRNYNKCDSLISPIKSIIMPLKKNGKKKKTLREKFSERKSKIPVVSDDSNDNRIYFSDNNCNNRLVNTSELSDSERMKRNVEIFTKAKKVGKINTEFIQNNPIPQIEHLYAENGEGQDGNSRRLNSNKNIKKRKKKHDDSTENLNITRILEIKKAKVDGYEKKQSDDDELLIMSDSGISESSKIERSRRDKAGSDTEKDLQASMSDSGIVEMMKSRLSAKLKKSKVDSDMQKQEGSNLSDSGILDISKSKITASPNKIVNGSVDKLSGESNLLPIGEGTEIRAEASGNEQEPINNTAPSTPLNQLEYNKQACVVNKNKMVKKCKNKKNQELKESKVLKIAENYKRFVSGSTEEDCDQKGEEKLEKGASDKLNENVSLPEIDTQLPDLSSNPSSMEAAGMQDLQVENNVVKTKDSNEIAVELVSNELQEQLITNDEGKKECDKILSDVDKKVPNEQVDAVNISTTDSGLSENPNKTVNDQEPESENKNDQEDGDQMPKSNTEEIQVDGSNKIADDLTKTLGGDEVQVPEKSQDSSRDENDIGMKPPTNLLQINEDLSKKHSECSLQSNKESEGVLHQQIDKTSVIVEDSGNNDDLLISRGEPLSLPQIISLPENEDSEDITNSHSLLTPKASLNNLQSIKDVLGQSAGMDLSSTSLQAGKGSKSTSEITEVSEDISNQLSNASSSSYTSKDSDNISEKTILSCSDRDSENIVEQLIHSSSQEPGNTVKLSNIENHTLQAEDPRSVLNESISKINPSQILESSYQSTSIHNISQQDEDQLDSSSNDLIMDLSGGSPQEQDVSIQNYDNAHKSIQQSLSDQIDGKKDGWTDQERNKRTKLIPTKDLTIQNSVKDSEQLVNKPVEEFSPRNYDKQDGRSQQLDKEPKIDISRKQNDVFSNIDALSKESSFKPSFYSDQKLNDDIDRKNDVEENVKFNFYAEQNLAEKKKIDKEDVESNKKELCTNLGNNNENLVKDNNGNNSVIDSRAKCPDLNTSRRKSYSSFKMEQSVISECVSIHNPAQETYEFFDNRVNIVSELLKKYQSSYDSWQSLVEQFPKVPITSSNSSCTKKIKDMKSILREFLTTDNLALAIPNAIRKIQKDDEDVKIIFTECLLYNMRDQWPIIFESNKSPAYHIVSLVRHLGQIYENFMDYLLSAIPYRMFRLKQTMDDHYSLLYSQIFIALCVQHDNMAMLTIFLVDSMYCLHKQCFKIVGQMLAACPGILQVSIFNRKENILHTTIKYLLLNFKSGGEKTFLGEDLKKIRQHIFYSYRLPEDSRTPDDILAKIMLLSKNEPSLEVYLSIILLSRREGSAWVMNKVVNQGFLALLQDSWDKFCSCVNELEKDKIKKVVKLCIDVLGAVCRTFNEDNKDKVVTVICLMKTILLKKELTPELQEAVVSALIQLSRHQYDNVVEVLLLWSPNFVPSQQLVNRIKRFLQWKSRSYWNCKVKYDFKLKEL